MTLRSLRVYYQVLVRAQLTRGRILGLLLLASIAILTAGLSRRASGAEDQAALFAIGDYGIALFVPFVALLLASPMLGNLVEDRLLVYLWLKPQPRWHLAVAAVAASFTVAATFTVVPLVVATLVAGWPGLAGPVALAAVLGTLGYSAAFVFLGLRFRGGLWPGLVYMVVWENIIARWGAARASLRSYLLSIVEWGTEQNISLADRIVDGGDHRAGRSRHRRDGSHRSIASADRYRLAPFCRRQH